MLACTDVASGRPGLAPDADHALATWLMRDFGGDVDAPIPPAPDWYRKAACLGMPHEGWFPEGQGSSTAAAIAVCNRCPVREQCLADAIEQGVTDGVWGGRNFSRTAAGRQPQRAEHCANHPDRPVFARGLCGACYQRDRRRRGGTTRPTPTRPQTAATCDWCGLHSTRPLRGPKPSPAPHLNGEALSRCETCDRYLRRTGTERPARQLEVAAFKARPVAADQAG